MKGTGVGIYYLEMMKMEMVRMGMIKIWDGVNWDCSDVLGVDRA